MRLPRPTTTEPRPGDLFAGRYLLERRIGAGGMGSVWKAQQKEVDRPVALKIIRPEHAENEKIVKRFLREMRATARIEHPNTVRLYDFGYAEPGEVFLAMEYVDGRTLSKDVKQGAFPAERVAWIGAQIARGLGAAHDQGIIHRDLKPANIMLGDVGGERERVKILDFGIAAFEEPRSESDKERLTVSGMVMGTPEFMAPEQVTPGPLDHRCDLYALGVCMYLMSTGKVPFGGGNPVTVMYAHVNEKPVPPSTVNPAVPPWLDAIILRLLEKKAERRFQHAGDVAVALEEAAGLPGGSTDLPSLPRVAAAPASGSQTLNLPAGAQVELPTSRVSLLLGVGIGVGIGALAAVGVVWALG